MYACTCTVLTTVQSPTSYKVVYTIGTALMTSSFPLSLPTWTCTCVLYFDVWGILPQGAIMHPLPFSWMKWRGCCSYWFRLARQPWQFYCIIYLHSFDTRPITRLHVIKGRGRSQEQNSPFNNDGLLLIRPWPRWPYMTVNNNDGQRGNVLVGLQNCFKKWAF